jgi:hypothetical protein
MIRSALSHLLPFVLFTSLLPACSTVVVEPDGNGGAGGSTTDVATTGTGKVTSTSTGGVCSAYADEAGSGPVTVRVINQSPLDIYLPSICGEADYTMVGSDQLSWSDRLFCALTCEELQTQPPIVCGACAPIALRVPANGSREIIWSGTSVAVSEMPAECWFDSMGLTTCGRNVAAPAQQYQVVLGGYAGCDDGTGAPCTCDETGSCYGDPVGQLVNPLPAFFQYPSSHQVDVIFDSCVFGCPG